MWHGSMHIMHLEAEAEAEVEALLGVEEAVIQLTENQEPPNQNILTKELWWQKRR
jgi:hypothetical protein